MCGPRPGWATHPATGGASGEARGQRAGARVRASQPWAETSPALLWPRLFFYQCLLFPPPVKATLWQYHIRFRRRKKKVFFVQEVYRDDFRIPVGKKCLHIITISPRIHPSLVQPHTPLKIHLETLILAFLSHKSAVCLILFFSRCRLEAPRWFSPILWRLLRSVCRWLERSLLAQGSVPWLLWGTWASLASTR